MEDSNEYRPEWGGVRPAGQEARPADYEFPVTPTKESPTPKTEVTEFDLLALLVQTNQKIHGLLMAWTWVIVTITGIAALAWWVSL